MSSNEVSVKFQPQGKTVRVAPGAAMREAVARAGILVDYPCGGQGTCGKCRIRMVGAAPTPTEVESDLLGADALRNGERLACRCSVEQDTTVEIPGTSVLGSSFQILGSGGRASKTVDPPVWKQYVELPPPTREDDAPDVERLKRALGDIRTEAALLRALPSRLRKNGFKGTAVISDDRLIDFEEGNTEAECYAVAFDVGTTTLVAVLLDLVKGGECATASRINPQTGYGDDVLSRILYARDTEGGLERLQEEVLTAVREMIAELATQAGVARDRIYEVTFAGNTTMQSLLARIDPSPLGESPFVPACREGLVLPSDDLNLGIHPRGQAYVLPVIGGFVGGDTVAGILATALDGDPDPVLLVDIGTNGEIVLHHEGRLQATSCAAGPAFEGARIAHGMRAAVGAIEKVRLNATVEYDTIGGARPVGLCGSALIDVAAELLRNGLVVSQGMMLDADSAPDTVAESVRGRLVVSDGEPAFAIATADETHTQGPVLLFQRDIRELQLATAAIKAGISIVLRRAGLQVHDLKRVLVAGAFGNYIRCRNAQRMGLLPHAIDESRIFFVGNTSLAGAQFAATSRNARRRAEEIARAAEHVDLSQDVHFHMEFSEAIFFPEPTEESE